MLLRQREELEMNCGDLGGHCMMDGDGKDTEKTGQQWSQARGELEERQHRFMVIK